MTAPILDELSVALTETQRMVDAVDAAQWSAPTPCTEWTVGDLVGHVAAGDAHFAGAFGAPPVESDSSDPAAAYAASARALIEALSAPGALEREVTLPIGTLPGSTGALLRLTETLTHGWDLARATGQLPAYADASVEQAITFSEGLLGQIPAERRPFDPPRQAPAGAGALDRLAALLGRDPGWRAPEA